MTDNPAIVAICNAALRDLGQNPIISLDDPSKAARLCKGGYFDARDAALRAYPWNGAMRRAILPALDEAPAFGFAYAYQLPEGPVPEYCLRVIEINGEPIADVCCSVEGRLLLLNDGPPARIRFIGRIEDPGQFDPLLKRAIGLRLAADIGYGLTGNRSLSNDCEGLFRDWTAAGRRADAKEGSSERITGSTWLEARR